MPTAVVARSRRVVRVCSHACAPGARSWRTRSSLACVMTCWTRLVVQSEKLCDLQNFIFKAKSKLAYVPYSGAKEVVDVVFEPAEEEGAFFEFEVISFDGCGDFGEGQYRVSGSVIGKIPRNQATLTTGYSEEAIMDDILFETTDEPTYGLRQE